MNERNNGTGNVIMTGDSGEWLKQAVFDMETADVLIRERRYLHVIFLCHLSLEKALKGLYTKKTRKAPPKTHSLVYLADLIGVPIPDPCCELISDPRRSKYSNPLSATS
jgi:HEPN domain-containing protein